MNRAFVLRRHVEVTVGIGGVPGFRVRSGVGTLLGPSDVEIMTRLDALASNMTIFEKEVDLNPTLLKKDGSYAKLSPEAKAAHEKFSFAWAGLYFDFWGNAENGLKYGDPGFIRGLYNRLKEDVMPMFYKDADMAEIVFYEARFAGIRKEYAKLGYKEEIEPPAPPIPPPSGDIPWGKYVMIGGIVLAGGYLFATIGVPLILAKAL